MTNRHIILMVWSVTRDGESNRLKVSKEAAEYALTTADKKLESLIEMGTEESRAYAEAAESMAGNVDEYNRVVAQAAQDTSSNMDNAAVSMAESIHKNSLHAQESLGNTQEAAWNLADAVQGAGKGRREGVKISAKGGGSSKGKAVRTENHTGNFTSSLSEYKPHEFDFDEFQSGLEIDIQGYADAISAIDSQIEILKNLQSTFESNGGIGGHGYAGKIKQLEKEREKINSAASSSSKETKETIAWVERALSRIQRTIKNLGNTVSATWKNWTKRNNALASELSAVREEIDLQKSAYDTYMQRAESTGLSDHYKWLVKNGSISIEDISDEALKEQIKTYKEWWTHATLSSNGQEKFYLTAGKPSRAL